MQERSYVALGFVPMVVGLVALGVMRRPEAVVARPMASSGADVSSTEPDADDDASEPMLGVIVAGHTADLGAEIGGSVVKVFVREGARVREGDPLVYIDSATANSEARMAQAELAQQMSALSRAEAEHGEVSDLLVRLVAAGSGIPEQTIVAAKAREASARAALEQARAGIDVGKARIHREQARVRKHLITAPFSGVVVMLGVDPGDVVAPGQPVARVISEDQGVRFAVPTPMRALARPGAAVSVAAPGVAETVRGQVSEILPEVDAASGMVFARARLDAALPTDVPLVAGTSVRVTFAEATP